MTYLYAFEVALLVVDVVRDHLCVGLLLFPREAFHHTVESILDATHCGDAEGSHTRDAPPPHSSALALALPGRTAAALGRAIAARQVTCDVTSTRCLGLGRILRQFR